MICSGCGQYCDDGTRFCPNCGSPLEDTGASDQNTLNDFATQVVPPVSVTATPTQRQNNSSLPIVVGIAAGIMMAIALALFVIKPLQQKSAVSTTKQPSAAAQSTTSEKTDDSDAKVETKTGSIDLTMSISDIDASDYPSVTLYLNLQTDDGSTLDGLSIDSFTVTESLDGKSDVKGDVSSLTRISAGGTSFKLTYVSSGKAVGGDYVTVRVQSADSMKIKGTCENTYHLEKEAETEAKTEPVVVTAEPVVVTAEPVVVTVETPVPTPVQPQPQTYQQPTYTASGHYYEGELITYADYVLPQSNCRYYSYAEIDALSTRQIEVARNELYARHGRGFRDDALQYYFYGQCWYSYVYDPDTFDSMASPFNDYENANLATILAVEETRY